jgi:hypothetical protein
MNQSFKVLIKITRYSLFVFLFSITSALQAQNLINVSTKTELNGINEKPYKLISFGEKINFGKIQHPIVWTVLSVDSNSQVVLNGQEINNYVFETPGIYQITTLESKSPSDNECNHSSFPESFLIKVSPIQMVFDFSTLTFNKALEGGVNLENTTLSLNVNLKSYTNEPVVFSKAKVIAAGVGTTISGQLVNDDQTLNVGSNKLVYKLTGSATKDSYIMLDFFDLNDQVQSYSYPTKL